MTINQETSKPRFPLGAIVITTNAQASLTSEDTSQALARHASGDWGDLCEEDRKENAFALDKRLRLFSAYRAKDGTKFWIITEADRSVTTILLPQDY